MVFLYTSINENPNHWWKSKENDDVLKVVSLNCAGLKSHFADIITDHTLLQADIIHLIETSLQPEDDEKNLNISCHVVILHCTVYLYLIYSSLKQKSGQFT